MRSPVGPLNCFRWDFFYSLVSKPFLTLRSNRSLLTLLGIDTIFGANDSKRSVVG